MIPDTDAFMGMLKNKDQVIKMILSDLDSCEKNQAAFVKLEQMYADGKRVNPDQAMAACAKAIRHSNDVNRRLLMVLMVYVSGSSYDGDVAGLLNKMGKGQEALQELFKRKLGR